MTLATKLQILIIAGTFTAGYIIGRFTTNKIVQKQEVTVSRKIEEQKQQVQTQATVQKDSTTVKITNKIEKYYSPKGKLVKVVDYSSTEGTQSADSLFLESKVNLDTFKSSEQVQKVTTTYQPNWSIFYQMPIQNLIKPSFHQTFQSAEIGFGYRITGNFHVLGSVDVNYFDGKLISDGKIGVMLQF